MTLIQLYNLHEFDVGITILPCTSFLLLLDSPILESVHFKTITFILIVYLKKILKRKSKNVFQFHLPRIHSLLLTFTFGKLVFVLYKNTKLNQA